MRGVPNKNEISDVVIINVVIKVESYSEAWKIVIKEIFVEKSFMSKKFLTQLQLLN